MCLLNWALFADIRPQISQVTGPLSREQFLGPAPLFNKGPLSLGPSTEVNKIQDLQFMSSEWVYPTRQLRGLNLEI